MNFLPRIPSSSKKNRASASMATPYSEKPEIEKLRKSLAEREVKILQDISNLSFKRSSTSKLKHQNGAIAYYSNQGQPFSSTEPLQEEAAAINVYEDASLAVSMRDDDELEANMKKQVCIAIEDLDEESKASGPLEYFGHPDIRVTSRDLKRAKGNLWAKRWDKNPLPNNSLPDHFQ